MEGAPGRADGVLGTGSRTSWNAVKVKFVEHGTAPVYGTAPGVTGENGAAGEIVPEVPSAPVLWGRAPQRRNREETRPGTPYGTDG